MRTRPKVFVIGLPKTGTTSLGKWLSDVGFSHRPWARSYDLGLLSLIDKTYLFREAEKYDSFDDMPWCYYYQDLAQQFPDAKFILTLRIDEISWWRSFYHHALRAGPNEVDALWYDGVPIVESNREFFTKLYSAHNQAVREFFASDPHRLVQFTAGQDDASTLYRFLGDQAASAHIPLRKLNAEESSDDRVVVERLTGKGKWTTALQWCKKARPQDDDLINFWAQLVVKNFAARNSRAAPARLKIRIYVIAEAVIRRILNL